MVCIYLVNLREFWMSVLCNIDFMLYKNNFKFEVVVNSIYLQVQEVKVDKESVSERKPSASDHVDSESLSSTSS